MELKILTMNIWRYYKWDKRKKKVIQFLKKQNADVVLFQEAASDSRLKKFNNQVEELNRELRYPYHAFHKLTKMDKWHEKPINWDMGYGFGILSKFPITSSKLHILPHIEKQKDFGFLHCIINITSGGIDLINVHFENTNNGSEKHLHETIKWCKLNNISPIIAGDFNLLDTNKLIKILGDSYEISYEIAPYFSFMPTLFSHNKEPVTLDYIVAHKKKFHIKKIRCIGKEVIEVTDHNPVLALIEIKE